MKAHQEPMRPAHVVHHVPGRIRFKVQRAQREVRLLARLESALSEIPFVHRVQVNASTGSVVIEYDRNRYAEVVERANAATERTERIRLISPEAAQLETAVEFAQQELQSLARHSLTAKELMALLHRINVGIKNASGNVVDLRVLLPLCLSAYSLASDKDKPSPLWVTLLIFSFNAFVSLHPPRPEPLV